MDMKQFLPLVNETMQAFNPFYREAMRKAIEDSGSPDNWFALSLARGRDPAPFTAEQYQAMFPYTALERFTEALEELAQLELLERVAEKAYQLTDLGREAVADIFDAAQQAMEKIEALPTDEMDRLNSLLYRVVEATLAAPEPKEKWALICSRWTDPGESASGSVKTDQYLTDLLRYRDDAHIAAWKPYSVNGHTWEALTLIWQDEAHTAEEVIEQRPRRGHSVEDYQAALQDLTARGWVAEENGAYNITAEGKQVREQAEEATERNFYVGWSALSEDELTELKDLLTRATDNLRATARDQLWGVAREVSQAIYPVTRDVLDPLFEKYGLDKPGLFHVLLSAQRVAPDPISTARLGIRDPYTKPGKYDELLAALTEAGFLASKGDGEYELTEKGHEALQETHHAFYTRLGEMPVLPEENMAQLEGLLNRLAEASLEAPEPAEKWGTATTHQGHPSQEYAALARIDRHLDDLNAFRDDAHLAAWKPHAADGRAWEALTFVWRGDAHTAEELVEKLTFRSHTAETYEQVLAKLAGRGWVEKTVDGYRVTDEGQALRQGAEDATNRYFFAPWACLSDFENAQLLGLLTQLRDNLREMAEDN